MCVQELRKVQQRPEAANASVQANLSYAVHAVACQAGMQHSTAQALQAQLRSLQVAFIVSIVMHHSMCPH